MMTEHDGTWKSCGLRKCQIKEARWSVPAFFPSVSNMSLEALIVWNQEHTLQASFGLLWSRYCDASLQPGACRQNGQTLFFLPVL